LPAQNEKQRKAFAVAEHEPDKLYARNRSMLKMKKRQLSEFATKPVRPSAKDRNGGF
jgi:hypothetical protein